MYINDYSKGHKRIIEHMSPYTINFSQKDAGFKVDTKETILEVDIKPSTLTLISKLKKDLVVEGESEVILADTAVKLMTKVHQLCSGTIKFESGNSMVIDLSKAKFIKNKFKKMKAGLMNNDYQTAADEMVDSNWYRQVGKRAKRLVNRMRDVGSTLYPAY